MDNVEAKKNIELDNNGEECISIYPQEILDFVHEMVEDVIRGTIKIEGTPHQDSPEKLKKDEDVMTRNV